MPMHKVSYPLPRENLAMAEVAPPVEDCDYRPSARVEVTEEIAKSLSIGDEITIVQKGKIEEIGSWDSSEFNVRIRLDSAELRSENEFEKLSREDD